nr:hypothetical protein [Kofleriaceae bacterium]
MTARLVASSFALAAIAACGSTDISHELGARCSGSADCADHCLTGSAWPDGLCSSTCARDGDCPDIARCIAEAGGSCAFACVRDSDCAFLGSGYGCHAVDGAGAGSQVEVCRGD